MSHGPNNYVDDVPMVLSTKWKISPIANLPDKCAAIFFETSGTLKEKCFEYDNILERKILEKVEEWKVARSREIDEREQRIMLRKEKKRKELEAEGTKLKEQLTQVYYPSSDEFSSSEEDEHGNNKISSEKQAFNSLGSILKPTVVSAQLLNEITNSDLATLSNVTMSKSTGNVWNYKNNASKLELADFENDASDPFYSMELKTIDDLDILAQVLRTSVTLQSKVNKNKASDGDKKSQEKEINPEPLKLDSSKLTQIDRTQLSSFQTHYGDEPYFTKLSQHSKTPFACSFFNSKKCSKYNNYEAERMPNTFIEGSALYTADSLSPDFVINPSNDTKINAFRLQAVNKKQSKSVNDIVKELEEELNSQKRRIWDINQSQKNRKSANVNIVNDCANCNVKTKQTNCDNLLLKKLPTELQNLAIKISRMGFPLERVCRITQQVHGDDKKV